MNDSELTAILSLMAIMTFYVVIRSAITNKLEKTYELLKKSDFSEVLIHEEFGGSPDGFMKTLRKNPPHLRGFDFTIRYKDGTRVIRAITYDRAGGHGFVTFPKTIMTVKKTA